MPAAAFFLDPRTSRPAALRSPRVIHETGAILSLSRVWQGPLPVLPASSQLSHTSVVAHIGRGAMPQFSSHAAMAASSTKGSSQNMSVTDKEQYGTARHGNAPGVNQCRIISAMSSWESRAEFPSSRPVRPVPFLTFVHRTTPPRLGR
jgi:hypothetical protein